MVQLFILPMFLLYWFQFKMKRMQCASEKEKRMPLEEQPQNLYPMYNKVQKCLDCVDIHPDIKTVQVIVLNYLLSRK